jgi:hypothetical protein
VVLEADAVDHQHCQAHVGERTGHQLDQRVLGPGHERAGHRRLRRRPCPGLDRLTDRLLQPAIPPGRDAGEHPLQHHRRELITAGEVLIGPDRQLALVVLGPHPRPLNRDAPAAEGDRPIIAAVPIRRPVRVVLAARAAHLLDLLSHQLLQHAQPNPDAQREQPLLRSSDQLTERLLDARWQRPLDAFVAGIDLPRRYGLHAVLLSSCRSGNSGDLDCEIALHAANGSGRGRENRHLKFYTERDNLARREDLVRLSTYDTVRWGWRRAGGCGRRRAGRFRR